MHSGKEGPARNNGRDPGFIIQRVLLGDADAESMRRGVRALMEHSPLTAADAR